MFDGKVLFTNPKPTDVIKKEIILSTRNFKDSIILDFFAGSGTTAQAVLELNKEDGGNRKFILVQLPEKCDEESEAFKANYKTIADISKERIRRAIQKIEKEIKEEEKKKDKELKFETPSLLGRVGVGLQKVITLDKLFTGNDQLKTNTVLQMKDAEIDFKTI